MKPEERNVELDRGVDRVANRKRLGGGRSASQSIAALSDALFAAERVSDVTHLAAPALRTATGAQFALLTLDGVEFHFDGDDSKGVRSVALDRLSAAISGDAGDVIWRNEAQFLRDADPDIRAEMGTASLAILPFRHSTRDTGAMVLGFQYRTDFPSEQQDFLLAAATLVGHAHQYARMLERKRAALEAINYLERASLLLGKGTDPAIVLEQLARLALPRLGDYAMIDLVNGDGSTSHAGVAHQDPAKEGLLQEYRRRHPVSIAPTAPAGRVLITGEPEVVPRLGADGLAKLAANPEQRAMLEQIGLSGYMVVPLLHLGNAVGTMVFGLTTSDRSFSTADVALAVAVGDRVSTVLHGMALVEESERTRVEVERVNAQLREQAVELEASNHLLQEQAVEMEQQTEEARALSEELENTLDDLRRSEGRFKALVDASAQAVWRSDPAGQFVEVSDEWKKLTGVTPTPEGQSGASAVHADDLERTLTEWRRALVSGTPFEIEHRLRLANGDFRWFFGRAVPIYDDDGDRIREWVGMHTDVHEQHTLSDEQRLLLLVGSAVQQKYEPDALVQTVLAALAEHLGVEQARLVDVDSVTRVATLRAAHTFLRDDGHPARNAPPIRRVALSHVTTDIDAQLRGEPSVVSNARTDPRTSPYYERTFAPTGTLSELSVPLLRAGKMVAALAVASGVPREWLPREIIIVRRVGDKLWSAYEAASMLKELEAKNAALAASEARLAGVVGSAMDAILSVDADGFVSVFNAAAEEVFGIRAENAMGMPLNQFIQSRLAVANLSADLPGVDALSTSDIGHPTEVVGYRADGGTFPAEATISQAAGDAGRALTIVLRDVTARRALEAQLLQAQKMEAVGRLAGGVAHDFNNILTVIRGCADFLRESMPTTDERRVDLDEMLAATDRATTLTRQLLTFSRKQVVLPRVLDVNIVVRGIEPMLRRLIGEEIELAVMLQGNRLAVRADLGQLEQVIINLAVNARDAMVQGGVLGIETDIVVMTPDDVRRHQLDPMTTAQATRVGEYVVIRVTDTGIGMESSIMEHVFEPFFTTKSEGHGTGLGLATVHGIVAQAGGHVRVRSVASEGTTFEVFLPRLRNDDSGEHPRAVQPEQRKASGTVLLVEDEVTVRRSVRRMLERAGYTVVEARHGADALLVWREHEGKIDLVLTDLRMPELGGRELIAMLRAIRPDLPAIAMSGYPPEMGIGPVENWGEDQRLHFLAKPFTTDALLSAVDRMLAVDA
ncbi:MAG: GAF domain-containing protein [Gemmatimonadota bacterium]